ncbi:MAG TPA: CRISPR-associated protein Cas5 [Candidatus Ratteibacteria bacterium]|jgi:CRISPR-associated Cas5-like protein|nr:CRISPR-associated protein Cas5 [bacterium]HRR06795.1 CRISPR-associated protein Cas5 [Victivallales bacterium]HRS05416.1 CRISPR-associated protein Cas5 [Candidatus Ratteibacteria bacterium]HRV04292.1 CRISPR-associated protein Cas5 [Candidatus Ratteibacteria bacterium]
MEEMREIIKIDIWGYTAHFRIYGNQNFCDSYPILPPSTFLGILKDLIGERPPEPFTLAIKGEFENLFFDYQSFLHRAIVLDDKKGWWVYRKGNRYTNAKKGDDVQLNPLYVKVLFRPKYTIYFYTEKHHDFYLSKLKDPKAFISLGRSEDLAMLKVTSTRAKKKEAKKRDKIKIENAYLPKRIYGSAALFLPISHPQNRYLNMEKVYYIQEAVSYYEGEYWETADMKDRFLWLLEYNGTKEGNSPKLLG